MAAPITIKKRKMTLNKPTPAPAGGGEEASADADATASSEAFPDDPSSAPFIAQSPMAAQATAPAYTVYAILAVLATLLFIALLIVQWTEWSDFSPHFPRPIQAGHIANPPSWTANPYPPHVPSPPASSRAGC